LGDFQKTDDFSIASLLQLANIRLGSATGGC